MMNNQDNQKLQMLLMEDYITLPEYLGFDIIDVNTQSHFGDYPLHTATVRNSMEELKLLCENGAMIDVQGEWGFTPLHNCVEFNHYDCAKYLLELGADQDIPSIDGDTPLDTAIGLGYQEMAELLLRYKKGIQSH